MKSALLLLAMTVCLRCQAAKAGSDSVSVDWLLDSKPYRAEVKRSADGSEVELSNGLIRRVFRLAPNAATG